MRKSNYVNTTERILYVITYLGSCIVKIFFFLTINSNKYYDYANKYTQLIVTEIFWSNGLNLGVSSHIWPSKLV